MYRFNQRVDLHFNTLAVNVEFSVSRHDFIGPRVKKSREIRDCKGRFCAMWGEVAVASECMHNILFAPHHSIELNWLQQEKDGLFADWNGDCV